MRFVWFHSRNLVSTVEQWSWHVEWRLSVHFINCWSGLCSWSHCLMNQCVLWPGQLRTVILFHSTSSTSSSSPVYYKQLIIRVDHYEGMHTTHEFLNILLDQLDLNQFWCSDDRLVDSSVKLLDSYLNSFTLISSSWHWPPQQLLHHDQLFWTKSWWDSLVRWI